MKIITIQKLDEVVCNCLTDRHCNVSFSRKIKENTETYVKQYHNDFQHRNCVQRYILKLSDAKSI